MKTKHTFILAAPIMLGLAAIAASGLGSSNGNGDILAELTVSAGGGVSTQPNGCTLALTIGFLVSPPQEPMVANASGAMLAMGFQALLLPNPSARVNDWMLYE